MAAVTRRNLAGVPAYYNDPCLGTDLSNKHTVPKHRLGRNADRANHLARRDRGGWQVLPVAFDVRQQEWYDAAAGARASTNHLAAQTQTMNLARDQPTAQMPGRTATQAIDTQLACFLVTVGPRPSPLAHHVRASVCHAAPAKCGRLSGRNLKRSAPAAAHHQSWPAAGTRG